MSLALPCRSPTTGLTWASATRSTRCIELNSAGLPPITIGVALAFFERLRALSKERRTMLCVGLDPDPERIDGAAAGALRHCREVALQTEEHACCFKPN